MHGIRLLNVGRGTILLSSGGAHVVCSLSPRCEATNQTLASAKWRPRQILKRVLLKRADPRGQERARKLGRASSRGPEAPIVVYNNPARSSSWTNAPRAVRTGCSNTCSRYY
ncbi:hypothetical protein IEO21_08720 [Rhodonia placenta]|uniref:Uncharacterized protein n=1 Tax=Rhodonia placenta TaxID=104341 RepID=A0A8H7NVN3_9APHY|nr:hypothetical protein IEO21_08720 [Postia placenta]